MADKSVNTLADRFLSWQDHDSHRPALAQCVYRYIAESLTQQESSTGGQCEGGFERPLQAEYFNEHRDEPRYMQPPHHSELTGCILVTAAGKDTAFIARATMQFGQPLYTQQNNEKQEDPTSRQLTTPIK